MKPRRPRSLQPRAHRGGTQQLEHLARLRNPLDRDHAERLHLDEPICQPHRLACQPGHARRRELLHPRCEMRRLSHRRVVHAQIAADGAHHYLAGVDADADLDLDPVIAACFLGVLPDQVLHP